MFGLGFWEIVIIFSVALIFLGPEKLPEIAKWFGKAYGEFRKVASDFKGQMGDFKENITPPRDYILPKNKQNAVDFSIKKEAEPHTVELDHEIKKEIVSDNEKNSSNQNQDTLQPSASAESTHDNEVSKT